MRALTLLITVATVCVGYWALTRDDRVADKVIMLERVDRIDEAIDNCADLHWSKRLRNTCK